VQQLDAKTTLNNNAGTAVARIIFIDSKVPPAIISPLISLQQPRLPTWVFNFSDEEDSHRSKPCGMPARPGHRISTFTLKVKGSDPGGVHMSKTTRRNLLKTAGAAGAAAGLGALIKSQTGAPVTSALAAQEHDHDNDKPISGPLANATVTFGAWQSGPAPYDRFVVPNDRTRNQHHLTPNVATIEIGGNRKFHHSRFSQCCRL